MSFVFKKDRNPHNTHDISEVEYRVDSEVSLVNLLDEFRLFLLACGYSVAGDIVVDEQEQE